MRTGKAINNGGFQGNREEELRSLIEVAQKLGPEAVRNLRDAAMKLQEQRLMQQQVTQENQQAKQIKLLCPIGVEVVVQYVPHQQAQVEAFGGEGYIEQSQQELTPNNIERQAEQPRA